MLWIETLSELSEFIDTTPVAGSEDCRIDEGKHSIIFACEKKYGERKSKREMLAADSYGG